jgi:hypothetical protein
MRRDQLLDLVKSKPYLFWDIKDVGLLSEESIVEAILNRGDFDDFLKLIELMGIEKVAEIFYKQITRRRKNYSQKTENFFRLFFERHLRALLSKTNCDELFK